MKIERKDEFGDIGVAKIYREGESTPYKTLIHGGTKHFDNIDFAEYDFNVILENHKFNSKDLISYLDKETSEKIGTNLGSLEKINSVLFPTLSNGDVNDVEYFNTLSISAVTLYLFNLDPGVNKIKLYESFSEDTSEDDWVVMITLEISSKWEKNPTIVKSDTVKEVPTRNDLWQVEHGSDVRIPRINEAWWVTDEDCAYVYKGVIDEINCGKAVWLALTTDNTVKDVNLSYYAWLQSEDANIYKHKFNLRNDDYYDKTKSEFLVSDNFGYTDRRSGKLLGNQLIVASDNSSCPILSRKLKDVKNRWSAGDVEYPNYDPEIEYKLGDLVILNGIVYKSVRKNNRGHFPGISSYWALKSSIDNIKTTRVTLLNYQRKLSEAVKFIAQEANSTVGLRRLSTNQRLWYSFDGVNWNEENEMTPTTNITLTDVGDSVFVRGILRDDNTEDDFTNFVTSGRIIASGNCSYLWSYENPDAPLKRYCGYAMFSGTSLIAAPSLPNITLSEGCYAYMFDGCTSLTTAPELPATVLKANCYEGMFSGCTSLRIAPEIPAGQIAESCYLSMFSGCTSLVYGPSDLPAKELYAHCYEAMFHSCTSLEAVPAVLSARNLKDCCYKSMFYGCTAITTTPVILAETMADHCCEEMFRDCSSLVTAPELPATKLSEHCYSAMFANCISLTNAPSILPATELSSYCYAAMFQDCTALICAPELPAENLTEVEGCYKFLFARCKELSKINCSALEGMNNNSNCEEWVNEVARTGLFIKHPDASWDEGGSGIPSEWKDQSIDNYTNFITITSLQDGCTVSVTKVRNPTQDAPKLVYSRDDAESWVDWDLSGIRLAENETLYIRAAEDNTNSSFGDPTSEESYYKFTITDKFNLGGNIRALMSKNSNNTVVPIDRCFVGLFAGTGVVNVTNEFLHGYNTLTLRCYHNMFSGCRYLVKAPSLPARVSAENCYNSMFWGCTSLTTAPDLPATRLHGYGDYWNMFSGCSALVKAPSVLPALLNSGSNGVYLGMFRGCTSLYSAPKLPSRIIGYSSYEGMFSGCTNLNYIECLATNATGSGTSNWVRGVANEGTFIKNDTALSWPIGNNGIPDGWTVINIDSSQPSNKIAYIYEINMDAGVTSPNKQITLDGENKTLSFKVINGSEYEFVSACLEKSRGNIVPLILSEDYTVDKITSTSTGDTIYYRVSINSTGWDKILGENSRKRLIFTFELSGTTTPPDGETGELQESVKIEVTDYNGFEVDNTNFSIPYDSSEDRIIQFYGYRDNLRSIDIYSGEGEDPIQILTVSTGWVESDNFDARLGFGENDTPNMYTLHLKNVRKDLTIKIIQQ